MTLAFVSPRFSSQKSSELLALPLSISAMYYDKLPNFLAQNYKWRLQFIYFDAITSSINSTLIQPSYSLSLFYWILVNCLMCLPTCSASIVHLTLSFFIPDKVEKCLRGKGRDIVILSLTVMLHIYQRLLQWLIRTLLVIIEMSVGIRWRSWSRFSVQHLQLGPAAKFLLRLA